MIIREKGTREEDEYRKNPKTNWMLSAKRKKIIRLPVKR
jgi:hypothetical protein